MSRFGLAPQDQPAQGREARAIAVLLTEVPAVDREAFTGGREAGVAHGSPEGQGAIGWHREAGYFQVDCGVPDHGVFCRPVDGISLRPNQDPWRRGINTFTGA